MLLVVLRSLRCKCTDQRLSISGNAIRLTLFQRVAGSYLSTDTVFCIWCLLWPTQKPLIGQHGWPDSVTILTVMSAFSNGCDVVRAGHRKCKQLGLEWNNKHQHRLSFSRAEIVLLNSWMPIQQIIYRMLRVFMKVGRWTSASDDTETQSYLAIITSKLWCCGLMNWNQKVGG